MQCAWDTLMNTTKILVLIELRVNGYEKDNEETSLTELSIILGIRGKQY